MFHKIRSRIGQFSQILALRLYGAGAAFVVTMLLGRLLGPAEFGAYVFAMSWLSLFLLAATLGFQHFAVRSIPPLLVKEDLAQAKGLILFAAGTATLLSLVVTTLVWANATQFAPDPIFQAAMAAVALLILPSAWMFLRTGIMQGLGHPVAAQIPDRLIAPTLLILALLACLVLAIPVSARVVLFLTCATIVVSLAIGALSLRNALNQVNAPPSFKNNRSWIIGAAKSAVAFAALTALAATDIVMLGLLSSPEETGLYGIAVRFFLLMWLPYQAAVTQMSHRVAKLYAQQDINGIAHVARGAANRGFIASIALALPATAAAFFLDDIFGPGFGAAKIPLLILVWARVLQSVGGQPDAVLGNTAHVGLTALSSAFAALVNLGLNAALIPAFGATGAAIATATSFCLMALSQIWLVRNRLGITTFIGRTNT